MEARASVAVVGTALLVLVLGGCATARHTVSGTVTGRGGEPQGETRRLDGAVELRTVHGDAVARSVLHDGAFSITADEGEYVVAYPGAPGCTVLVTIDRDLTQDLTCELK